LNEIDKGVTVEKTVTMGETHYRALLAERDRLREALYPFLNGGVPLASMTREEMDYVRRARAALKGDTQ
jgi:hypothetical protein